MGNVCEYSLRGSYGTACNLRFSNRFIFAQHTVAIFVSQCTGLTGIEKSEKSYLLDLLPQDASGK